MGNDLQVVDFRLSFKLLGDFPSDKESLKQVYIVHNFPEGV